MRRLLHASPWERRDFQRIFGVPLSDYFRSPVGFDVVKFDEEIVQPPDGMSTRQHLLATHGQEAVNLIEQLIGVKP